MSEYSKIQNHIWHSKTFNQLSDNAKFLWLYLLTCPHGNLVGLYVLKSGYAQEDLGWTLKKFNKAFDELLTVPLSNGCRGLIKYDAENSLVLIKNYLEHNGLRNPNQIKAGVKKISDLPHSPLFQDLKQFIEQLSKQLGKQSYEQLIKQLDKPAAAAVTVAETAAEEALPTAKQTEPAPSKNSKHFNDALDKQYLKPIKEICQELSKKSSGSTSFNPFAWVQQKVKSRKHPGAVLKALQSLLNHWETTRNPIGYLNAIMKTESGNFYYNDHMVQEAKRKKEFSELGEVLHGVLK
ncbi:MAG: hypothetical protein JRJ86_15720 [Deltaproteobacteria bacterium]|nr:hypothetical protein [Deltaproteobacteria bacterium]